MCLAISLKMLCSPGARTGVRRQTLFHQKAEWTRHPQPSGPQASGARALRKSGRAPKCRQPWDLGRKGLTVYTSAVKRNRMQVMGSCQTFQWLHVEKKEGP